MFEHSGSFIQLQNEFFFDSDKDNKGNKAVPLLRLFQCSRKVQHSYPCARGTENQIFSWKHNRMHITLYEIKKLFSTVWHEFDLDFSITFELFLLTNSFKLNWNQLHYIRVQCRWPVNRVFVSSIPLRLTWQLATCVY